ncbi:hypothetical protein EWM64_g2688 [Hericium alpestre]|uniref:(2E,6E)-farnesyl diphosphate synthase n=1 Tax=Hericium alpestre TaxID=135208 RepID=A0A4Z0A6P6_9AGAM|nr:hypothetical protein EWM64_g2688 [Hericium alpestre]
MAPAALSPTAQASSHSPQDIKTKAQQQTSRQRFVDTWTIIRNELLDAFKAQGVPPEAVEWYKSSLDYNVPGGKLNRGLSVVDSVEIFKGRPLTDDEYLKAAILGWGVELAYFLVTDDLMDGSITRRGQPCWYRVPKVGNIAVNDGGMLKSCIFVLVKNHFKREPYYVDLLELYQDMAYITETGQLVDLITAPEDNVDLSKFSLNHYKTIVTFKTAFYSFYLPVALAMTMCRMPVRVEQTTPYQIALDILIPLGEYFQIQDDFLDFAGTPEQIGKIGTDIVDNKCSWCVNTTLAVASPAQRAVLNANYGRKDAACEARVKAVFEEVGLREKYEAYEREAYEQLSAMIDEVPEVESVDGGAVLRKEAFRAFLEKVYKRSK